MVRETQPKLSKEWQKVLDHYAYVFRHVENLSAVTIRNYLSDSRQFMVWCEGCRQEEHCEPSFMLQRVTLISADLLSELSTNLSLAQIF